MIRLGLTTKIRPIQRMQKYKKNTDNMIPIYFWAAKITLYSGFRLVMKICLKSVNITNWLTGLLTLKKLT
jgi:hypothetical protein